MWRSWMEHPPQIPGVPILVGVRGVEGIRESFPASEAYGKP